MSLVNYQFLLKILFLYTLTFAKKYISKDLILQTVSRCCLFCGSFLLFMFHVCLYYTFVTVPCDHLLVRAGHLALLCEMFPLCFATLQYGVLGQE